MSRQDRALKIWLSIRIFGMAAFRAAVTQGIDLAKRAANWVASSPTLELLTPASAGIVCFRVNPAVAELDEAELHRINKNVLARVFWDGSAFISSTSLHDTFALRMCVINHTTTWDDVRETLENITRFGMEAAASAGRIERMTPDGTRRRDRRGEIGSSDDCPRQGGHLARVEEVEK